jgi:hypothetical protein
MPSWQSFAATIHPSLFGSNMNYECPQTSAQNLITRPAEVRTLRLLVLPEKRVLIQST